MKFEVMPLHILFCCTLGLVACGGGGGSAAPAGSTAPGSAPATPDLVDSQAPSATITFPPALSATDSATTIVTGTASDNGTITVVRVNGIDATSSDGFATWQASVPLVAGVNALTVETGDMALNTNANAASVNISFNGTVLLRPFAIDIDTANNRALVVESPLLGASKGIASVDLTTGTRTTLSDASTPDSVNPFTFLGDVAVDAARNRVLAADFNAATIFAVDSNGARTVFSSNSVPDGINPFGVPTALVLDSDNDKLYVMDSAGGGTIFSVDINTGARTILSNNTFPNANAPLFSDLDDIALDSANKRLLVIDSVFSNDLVIAIDLDPAGTPGARMLLSDETTPNTANLLNDPRSIDVDVANNRALVVSRGNASIVAVSLTDGAQTLLSDNTTPDAISPFVNITGGITIDSANNRALVVDTDASAVVGVNLATGARTKLTNTSTPDAINPLSNPFDAVFDSANNRVLIADFTLKVIVAVDVTTGARTILSDGSDPVPGNAFVAPVKLAFDTTNNRALLLEQNLNAVIAVNLTDGTSTIFSDSTTPDGVNPFSAPNGGIVFDSANNRTLVLDGSAIIAVDSSGARTLFSNGELPAFLSPSGIAIDLTLNRALVVDGDKIIAVNLADGTRTLLSDATTPTNANVLVSPTGIKIDAANNRALVTDSGLDAVVAVSLTSGERTIVSDSTTPDSANSFLTPRGLVLDASTNNILVIDSGLNALLAVDPVTGSRVQISK